MVLPTVCFPFKRMTLKSFSYFLFFSRLPHEPNRTGSMFVFFFVLFLTVHLNKMVHRLIHEVEFHCFKRNLRNVVSLPMCIS